MAIEIEITCTTRDGKRLETRTIRGADYPATLADRVRVRAELVARYTEQHSGVTPYVFTTMRSVDA